MKVTRLEQLRKEHNLTNRELAKIIDVPESVCSKWENDKTRISIKRLVQLSNYYKVNIDYIMKLTNERYYLKNSNDINKLIICTRVKEIRDKLDLSLSELSNEINVPKSSLHNYENGVSIINIDILKKLCKLSNYSIDYVLSRTDNKYIIKKKLNSFYSSNDKLIKLLFESNIILLYTLIL